MKTLSWKGVDANWARLHEEQQLETAQDVTRYCIGHSTEEVAEYLDRSTEWVEQQLDYAGMYAATGEPVRFKKSWLKHSKRN